MGQTVEERLLGRRERWLVALVVVGALGALTAWTTHASLSATALNTGNVLATGHVSLGTNAAQVPLYDESHQLPGSAVTRCLRVTYTGSLDADLRLYASPVGAVGEHLDLVVTAGSGATIFPNCTGFTPRPGPPVFAGTLADLAATHSAWTSGLPLAGPSPPGWSTGDAVVYRFELAQRPSAGQALETGPHTFTWEARNR